MIRRVLVIVALLCAGVIALPIPGTTAPGLVKKPDTMILTLHLPAQHPYLSLTAEGIAQAKQRIAQYAWAKAAMKNLRAEADDILSRPVSDLPPKGDDRHYRLADNIRTAGLVFAFTGERRYAEWARDRLLDYADIYPGLPLTRGRCKVYSASSLQEAMWVVIIAEAYDLVADSGVFTPEQKRHVENDLLRVSTVCFKIDDFKNDPRIQDLHYRCYNFQAWHLAAVGLVGLALRDPALIDYAVNSPYGFRHLVAHDIRDDGIFWERSIGYHQFVIEALIPLTEAMLHCGVDLYHLEMAPLHDHNEDAHYVTETSTQPKSFRLMFVAPFYLVFPNLSFIAMGDSDTGPLHADWRDLVAYQRYHAPELAWLLERDVPLSGERAPGQSHPDWHWLIYDAPQLEAGHVPERSPVFWRDGSFANTGVYRNGCSLFPSTGLAVLRQQAGDITAHPDSTAAALSYGPYGGGHGHPDKLSLVLYADGRQWIPLYGSMPYETHWKAEWSAQTVSHNTVVAGGISQRPTRERDVMWPTDNSEDRVEGKLERFDAAKKRVSASCDSAYPGLTLRRTVQLSGNCVVDVFDVAPYHDPRQPAATTRPLKPRQLDYVLHIDGTLAESSAPLTPATGALGSRCGYQYVMQQKQATLSSMTALTFEAGRKRLRVWVVPAGDAPQQLILADGLTNTPGTTMPMLLLRQTAASARFVTVLEPVDPKNPVRSVSWHGGQLQIERADNATLLSLPPRPFASTT